MAKLPKKAAKKAAKKSPKKSAVKPRTTVDVHLSVMPYIQALAEPRRSEIAELDALIRATCPKLQVGMYGKTMIGYGPFHYKYATGREGDAYKIALSSRAQYISLYCLAADAKGFVAEQYKTRLPKADIGKSCVRFKRLADVDLKVITELLKQTETTGYSE
jgi:hypothetical protein